MNLGYVILQGETRYFKFKRGYIRQETNANIMPDVKGYT